MKNNFYKVDNNFFENNALEVCKKLIGAKIIFNSVKGKVVFIVNEIEAYLGVNDKASHSYNNKKTNRTSVMYESGGHIYIYFIYGLYYNLNFITDVKGKPSGILIRSIQIIEGHDIVSVNRYGKNYNELNAREKKNLSNGPGKVCMGLGLNKNYYGKFFTEYFEIYASSSSEFYQDKRIGIDYAGEDSLLPYRFILK